MDKKYADWIQQNVSETYGTCKEVTLEMAEAFPEELKRVRGHYHCPIWGERAHWWLVDTNGGIVDPTACQFPSGGAGVYQEWVEGTEEPTGMCPNCGGYSYNGRTCCCDKCHHEFIASIGM